MADDIAVRRLDATDLRAYKALRDEMLEAFPEAFTSDAVSERQRRADDYLPRLGLERPEGGHLLLGAFDGETLIGAIGLERDRREKVRHIGHVIGTMVRAGRQGHGVGAALLEAVIAEARGPARLEILTLTVTDGYGAARRLYERYGFVAYGTLHQAIKVGGRYHAKVHMALHL